MALTIKDPEADRLARELAALTGETLTTAVRTALAERLEQEHLVRRIREITEHFASLPVFDDRTPDEIIGYDENGMW